MTTDGAVIANDAVSCGSAPGSPKNRVKFLCSHGGKILPRPADAHLKYVGGETRVISVPRDITFQELMKKLTYLIDDEMILKYQVVSEDLDALVSVKSDEDLSHMFNEIDRYEIAGSPRLRAFLFPANNIVTENQTGPVEPHALEQRYIDSINGIIRTAPLPVKQPRAIRTMHGSLVTSSACSSPTSPDSCTTETIRSESMLQSIMPKVQSSPSICSSSNIVPQQSSHCVHRPNPRYYHDYRQAHFSGYHSRRASSYFHRRGGPERVTSCARSVRRGEGMRYQVDPAPQFYHYAPKQNRRSGYYDERGYFSDNNY